MTEPLVTIVTPSFNQGQFIRATIESVLSQDYPRVEYIVMDGGSTDDTAQVVCRYANRLRFVSEKDRGQTHAINKGFQMAKGSIVAWLNSDDVLLPGAVRAAVDALRCNPGVGAIYGEGFQIDIEGGVRQQFPYTEPFNLWKLTFVLDYILQQTVFFRRQAVEDVGWLDESLHFGMDWDLLVRLGKRFGLAYTPAKLGCIREYEAAKSFAGGGRRFDELASLVRKHSGVRFPPGFFFYGLDTYDKIWAERLRTATPRMLSGIGDFLATRLVYLSRYWIDRVQFNSQGLFADGWAGECVHYMTPGRWESAVLYGHLPAWSSALTGQQITIFRDGKRVARQRVEPGDFSIELPLSGDGDANVFRIEASHSMVPNRAGDGRRLSYQLLRVAEGSATPSR